MIVLEQVKAPAGSAADEAEAGEGEPAYSEAG